MEKLTFLATNDLCILDVKSVNTINSKPCPMKCFINYHPDIFVKNRIYRYIAINVYEILVLKFLIAIYIDFE